MRDKDAEACKSKIKAADPAAVEPGAFWPSEINNDAWGGN
jgi:hypothetical protein